MAEEHNPETIKDTTPEEESKKQTPESPKKKRHLISNGWIRIPLKVLMWLIVVVLLIPVLLYVPPVQTLVKNLACDFVYKSTGMKIDVDRFRLKFPVDVHLDGVTVLEQTGDTMVSARSLIAKVKPLPLLKLDVKIEQLKLNDGYYRMVSADSSMILSVRAALLEADDKSSANIATSEILLNKVRVKNGDLKLYMNVWKKKPTPVDSTAPQFLIKGHDISLENFNFAMSMLPTIDTMTVRGADIRLRDGVVDLRNSKMTARAISASKGNFTYLTPTPEYVKANPAPVDTVSEPSAPFIISADSLALDGFHVVYAMKGAKPLPGFDANYIELSDVGAGLRNFYNEATTVRLPVTRITAKERCGLFLTDGHGLVEVDSTGLTLTGMKVSTPYSRLSATAGLPFALMELQPHAPLNATLEGNIGMPDIEAFMPDLKTYTQCLPYRNPLNVNVDVEGYISDAVIERLDAAIDHTFSLSSSGYAENALDFNKMVAEVDFDASLENPSLISKLLGKMPYRIPQFTLRGTAGIDNRAFDANLNLHTPDGRVAATGYVSLNSEGYNADVNVDNFNVASVMPSLGVGHVSATLVADGAGFDPTKNGAKTHISLNLASVVYNHQLLKDIYADVSLAENVYTVMARSHSPYVNLDLEGNGTVAPDRYTFDLAAQVRDLNLYELGLSKEQNSGSANIYLTGLASPGKWIYNADLKIDSIQWLQGNNYYHAKAPIAAKLDAGVDNVTAILSANQARMDFEAEAGLQKIIQSFTLAADTIMAQAKRRDINVEGIQSSLPRFALNLNASGKGILGQFLTASGISVDTVHAAVSNDSLIRMNALAMNLKTSSMRLDTITLLMKERGKLIDYQAHLGNRKGNMDELSQVNLNGYFGSNRLLASLTQKNVAGKTGYRLGVTAAMLDSAISLHFTPLKATIAYLPWTINLDNHVDYYYNGHINANLEARSNESAIALHTTVNEAGNDELHAKLDNIHIQDFINMIVNAPPVTGTINSDMTVAYTGSGFEGNGTLGINDLVYDKIRVGSFALGFNAGLENSGATSAEATLKVENRDAAQLSMLLAPDSATNTLTPKKLDLQLTKFPASVANAFLGADVASLSGALSGRMDMSGTFLNPLLNGELVCDSLGVYLPIMGTTLRFDNEPLTVANNLITFNKFDIWAVNKNPITIDGNINAYDLKNISLDMAMNGSNVQLVGTKPTQRTTIRGKLFMDLNASARGPLKHFTINANANVLPSTDVTYIVDMTAQQLDVTNADDIVKFVNFNDTTTVAAADSVPTAMAMRVIAALSITNGAEVTVGLGEGTDKVQLTPYGTLNYFQNYMGDMRLNGQLNLGSGFARYTIPVMGQKQFEFQPDSYVAWNGNVMNPVLNIHATDKVKATVVENSNSRLVNFLVGLNVTNNLEAPKVAFDLSTEDDMTIENQLTSMSADQRSQCAMNMLITGQYSEGGTKTDAGPMTNQLYGFLSSQLNNWAAKAIKGVDLSFGIDQYDRTVEGRSSSAMSYSYQMSKSLFNNRFKINVGGNYTTDASANENFSENLINDISFEYMLKQTSKLTMYVRLFRHTGYESILEGEITETGVGFVMKRRLQSLRGLFRLHKKHRDLPANVPDSVATMEEATLPDSLNYSKSLKQNEK